VLIHAGGQFSADVFDQLLAILVLITLVTPVRYLVKSVFFILGFGFWHVIPVLAALGSKGRARYALHSKIFLTGLKRFAASLPH